MQSPSLPCQQSWNAEMKEADKIQGIDLLTKLITEDNQKLPSVLGVTPGYMMEIHAYLLETYLDAIKSDPDFKPEVFQSIKGVMACRTYRAKTSPEEDHAQVMRRMEVAAMIDRMKERR